MFYNKSSLQLTRFPCNTHDKTDRGSFERNSHFVAVLRGTFPGFQQLSSAAESSKDNGGLPEKKPEESRNAVKTTRTQYYFYYSHYYYYYC